MKWQPAEPNPDSLLFYGSRLEEQPGWVGGPWALCVLVRAVLYVSDKKPVVKRKSSSSCIALPDSEDFIWMIQLTTSAFAVNQY